MKRFLLLIFFICSLPLLFACGQSGKLYLPDKGQQQEEKA